MKLTQLVPDGQFLKYKGDWVTTTAYNVNDCVTWTDGHLYEVIKAHTSSDTFAPSNTEYYKAMTASGGANFVTLTSNINSTGIYSNEIKAALSSPKIQGASIKILDYDNKTYGFICNRINDDIIQCIGTNTENPTIDGNVLILFKINNSGRTIMSNSITKITFKNDAITMGNITPQSMTLIYRE